MSEEENKSVEPQSEAAEANETVVEEVNKTETHDMPTEKELGAIYDVPVQVTAVLGRASLHVNQLLKLGRGAVVELDRKVGEAIDIFVNDRLVARGEIVVMDDEHVGVTMTEIIKSDTAA